MQELSKSQNKGISLNGMKALKTYMKEIIITDGELAISARMQGSTRLVLSCAVCTCCRNPMQML